MTKKEQYVKLALKNWFVTDDFSWIWVTFEIPQSEGFVSLKNKSGWMIHFNFYELITMSAFINAIAKETMFLPKEIASMQWVALYEWKIDDFIKNILIHNWIKC